MIIKARILLIAVVSLLTFAVPAHAQRVFVSGNGNDASPCSLTAPCRSFQHAHDVVAANGEIDVLDPAGYGAITINKSISIQAHGFGGITMSNSDTSSAAIAINAGASDTVTLNGLLLDGAGSGYVGIKITSGNAQILSCVVRHFFGAGIFISNTTAYPADLLIEDTIASDNALVGISDISYYFVTLNRITANFNGTGVYAHTGIVGGLVIMNSVMSNNRINGLYSYGSNYLGKSTISGNGFAGGTGSGGVWAEAGGGALTTYGDNYINTNAYNDIYNPSSVAFQRGTTR